MKRVTVSITVTDSYNSYKLKKVRSAMINAGVSACTENDQEIAAIDARVGTPRTPKAPA